MTKEQFAKNQAEELNISDGEFHRDYVVLKCRCGYDCCNGWVSVNRKNKHVINIISNLYK